MSLNLVFCNICLNDLFGMIPFGRFMFIFNGNPYQIRVFEFLFFANIFCFFSVVGKNDVLIQSLSDQAIRATDSNLISSCISIIVNCVLVVAIRLWQHIIFFGIRIVANRKHVFYCQSQWCARLLFISEEFPF